MKAFTASGSDKLVCLLGNVRAFLVKFIVESALLSFFIWMSKLSIGASFAIIVCFFSVEVVTGRCLRFLCGNSSFTSKKCGLAGLGFGKLWYTVELGWCVGSNPTRVAMSPQFPFFLFVN
jgi:hypothetical protein